MSAITNEVLALYRTRPRVALLMSGAGSNAETILRTPGMQDLYDISHVVTDNPRSRAAHIANEHGLGLITMSKDRIRSQEERDRYFTEMADALGSHGVQAAFYAGFLKISTSEFCATFPGVNVHPANLAITGLDGVAKYRGMQALPAMRSVEGYVQATVHVVDTPVDTGAALTITPKLYPSSSNETDDSLHHRLKAFEHAIYPQTLLLLGAGQLDLQDLPLQMEEL